jgi:hypothetical protein
MANAQWPVLPDGGRAIPQLSRTPTERYANRAVSNRAVPNRVLLAQDYQDFDPVMSRTGRAPASACPACPCAEPDDPGIPGPRPDEPLGTWLRHVTSRSGGVISDSAAAPTAMRAAAPNDCPELAVSALADAALAGAARTDVAPAAAVAPTPQVTAAHDPAGAADRAGAADAAGAANATPATNATLATRVNLSQLAGSLILLSPPKLLPLISYKAMLPTAEDSHKGRAPHAGNPPQWGA